MTEFMNALLSCILPALIDRQLALTDWITRGRSRSVMSVESQFGWSAAKKFRDDTLANSINQRAPFGTFDPTIYHSAFMATLPTSHGRSTCTILILHSNVKLHLPVDHIHVLQLMLVQVVAMTSRNIQTCVLDIVECGTRTKASVIVAMVAD